MAKKTAKAKGAKEDTATASSSSTSKPESVEENVASKKIEKSENIISSTDDRPKPKTVFKIDDDEWPSDDEEEDPKGGKKGGFSFLGMIIFFSMTIVILSRTGVIKEDSSLHFKNILNTLKNAGSDAAAASTGNNKKKKTQNTGYESKEDWATKQKKKEERRKAKKKAKEEQERIFNEFNKYSSNKPKPNKGGNTNKKGDKKSSKGAKNSNNAQDEYANVKRNNAGDDEHNPNDFYARFREMQDELKREQEDREAAKLREDVFKNSKIEPIKYEYEVDEDGNIIEEVDM